MRIKQFTYDQKGLDTVGKYQGIGVPSKYGTKRGTFSDYKKPKNSNSFQTPFRTLN